MRVFIGVPLAEDLKDRVVALQKELGRSVKMKAVAPENLHWTVKFIGDVDVSQIEGIKTILDTLKSSIKPFSITVKGLGGFPDTRRPKIVWLGVAQKGEFVSLLTNVEKALSHYGPRVTEHEPHMTIARVKEVADKIGLKKFFEKNANKELGEMRIDRLVLFESTLAREGLRNHGFEVVRTKFEGPAYKELSVTLLGG